MCYSLTDSEKRTVENFKRESKKVCIYCGKTLLFTGDVTVDHLQPVSRNGQTCKTNLGICCSSCNTDKSDMTYNEYIEYLDIKKELLSKNKIWLELNSAIKSLQKINSIYDKALINVSKLLIEKEELEREIKNPFKKYNAAEGFMFFKSLREVLNELDENENIIKNSKSTIATFKENIKQLKLKKSELENKIMKEIRNECNIGRIGKLNIDKIDFSKWSKKKVPIHKVS